MVAVLSAYLSGWPTIYGRIEFTNLKCNSLDTTFLDFEYCFVKSVNQSYKYASVKVNLFQVPIRQVSMRFSLLKIGFQPFLYNITFDACKFLKTRKFNKVVDFFYGFFEKYSNMNHTCPYDHDVLVEKLPVFHLKNMFGTLMPVPEGEYQIDMVWKIYNIPRAHVTFQFKKAHK